MRLSINEITANNIWLNKGYSIPKFDIYKLRDETYKEPVWIHFGAGNIFRMFPAEMQQRLINGGEADKGVIVCECFDEEIIEKVFKPYDNLSLAVTLKASGEIQKTVVGSITESLTATSSLPRLKEIFEAPSLQMVSFTITEKGYELKSLDSEYLPWIKRDIENHPSLAKSIIGIVTYLAYQRYLAGKLPIAFVSMDNCSHNGDKLCSSITEIAEKWLSKGFVEQGFVTYLSDASVVAFPLTMIDKITPRPSEEAKSLLEADGLEEAEIFCTAKNSYVSCFVNAEETGYLIIEDIFPNGRPKLEKSGAIFTNRETVDKVEKMKVCTCLNPLHTVLAVFGCLFGYQSISAEMTNKDLRELVNRIGYGEGLPVVVNPGIIDPKLFIDEVINLRFSNPFIPDTPQRIACDTSQKIHVRFGVTLSEYVKRGYDISSLKYIPLFFAAWLRYLLAIDDSGLAFEPSPDPQLSVLQEYLKDIKLGYSGDLNTVLHPILSNEKIFGVNLYEYGLADKVIYYFTKMILSTNAVASTLAEAINC